MKKIIATAIVFVAVMLHPTPAQADPVAPGTCSVELGYCVTLSGIRIWLR